MINKERWKTQSDSITTDNVWQQNADKNVNFSWFYSIPNHVLPACWYLHVKREHTLNQGPWIRDRRIEAGEAKQQSWLSTPPDRHLLDCSTKPLFPMFFVSCGGHCVKSLHWKTLQSLLFPLKHRRSCIMTGYMPLSFTSLEVLTYLVFLSRLDINFNPYLSQMKR